MFLQLQLTQCRRMLVIVFAHDVLFEEFVDYRNEIVGGNLVGQNVGADEVVDGIVRCHVGFGGRLEVLVGEA